MLKVLCAALAVTIPTAAFPQQNGIVVTPLTSAVVNSFGQPITFPQGPGQIEASLYEIPPGAQLPLHKHPAPRIGYVLEGTLQVADEDTGETRLFKPGQIVLESVGQWHKGSNPGSDKLRLLVIDLQPKGAGNPTVLKP